MWHTKIERAAGRCLRAGHNRGHVSFRNFRPASTKTKASFVQVVFDMNQILSPLIYREKMKENNELFSLHMTSRKLVLCNDRRQMTFVLHLDKGKGKGV